MLATVPLPSPWMLWGSCAGMTFVIGGLVAFLIWSVASRHVERRRRSVEAAQRHRWYEEQQRKFEELLAQPGWIKYREGGLRNRVSAVAIVFVRAGTEAEDWRLEIVHDWSVEYSFEDFVVAGAEAGVQRLRELNIKPRRTTYLLVEPIGPCDSNPELDHATGFAAVLRAAGLEVDVIWDGSRWLAVERRPRGWNRRKRWT